MQSRRDFLKAGGMVLAGFRFLPNGVFRAPGTVELIEMRSDTAGSHVWLDPIGLYVDPGTTVRWITRENVHTATAYHPRNNHHSLRIPERAVPWDSGFLVHAGDRFEVMLTVPGVYDYFCAPHEAAGMVGRIVVGRSDGPGAEPFDYWVGRPGTEHWLHVPEAARKNFPSVARILAERRVHLASSTKAR